MILLTDEQKNAVRSIIEDINQKKPVIVLSGAAGTGKSTVIKHIFEALKGNFGVVAPTGKASNVLRKKGMPASTIHSLIYTPDVDVDGKVTFSKVSEIPYGGLIIDEASMVSDIIDYDLTSFDRPLVFVGDHHQLEPVGDGAKNRMKKPDYVLKEIHRNAGEIAFFAEHIRNGYSPKSFEYSDHYKKNVRFINKYDVEKFYLEVNQVICAYNKTRVEINKAIRERKGLNPNSPEIGDKIMCLKNNKEAGLFNGMQGIIKYMRGNKLVFESDTFTYEIKYDKTQFNKEKYDYDQDKDAPNPFDYAYAITCHKAQGDEWNKVLVIEQKCKLWDHSRWAYTAASRAKTNVYWVSG